LPRASTLGRDRWVATQFHPEKSGLHGLRLYRNFLRWAGVLEPEATAARR